MEILHIVGSVASVLALLAAVWAALNARSARQAAEAARRGVQAVTLAEELGRVCSQAQDLVLAVRARDVERVNRLAGELRVETGRLTARRSDILGPADIAELARVRAALRCISVSDGGPGVDASFTRGLEAANRAADLLATVLGHVQRAADASRAEERAK